MDYEYIPVPLPHDYQDNALYLLVQSPRVIYVYWELSPGLKKLLEDKENVQIRLNSEGHGVFYTTDFDMYQKSFYFSGVNPGFVYNCEIGIMTAENIFYPLLSSNSVSTPVERPADERIPTQASSYKLPSSSSWCLPKVDK